MNRILFYVVALVCLCGQSLSQDFDSDFRICDGLPGSQRAFAIVLGDDELKDAALQILSSTQIDVPSAIQKLFHPAPNSLIQLNGRADQFITPVQLANQLQMRFNQIVASKLQAATSDNIVCSMSLLSYREASDVFGKRIANQYGVVQVTIRNTDSNHEFLLHQVDFWFGDTLQYYATRDRKIARGVAEKGQAVDPRNVAVRVLEGIGSVAGPVTNIYSNDAKLASSIYNSSFIPAVKYVFPDLTVQQMGRLDDMGFSAGASTMVIPKNGAISFVAFIPADSFLIPKLAQYEAELDPNSPMGKKIEDCSKWQQEQLAMAAKSAEGKNITTERAQTDARLEAICNQLIAPRGNPAVGALSSQTVRQAKGKSTEMGMTSILTFGMHTKRRNIGSFDAAVILLLQRDLNILVSGSHIQQLTTQLAINSVVCSMPDPLVTDSVVNCALTGNNLNLVTQGRLISQTDSTVSVPSSGLKATKDDPAHAQLSFSGCSFVNKPQGNYLLEIGSAGGTQQNPSPQTLKPNAFACTRSGSAVNCQLPSKVNATSVTLTGTDKKTHTLTPKSDGTVDASQLPSGTYDVTAATSDKPLNFCAVTF